MHECVRCFNEDRRHRLNRQIRNVTAEISSILSKVNNYEIRLEQTSSPQMAALISSALSSALDEGHALANAHLALNNELKSLDFPPHRFCGKAE